MPSRAGKARLEELARKKAREQGRDPDEAQVSERAQTNFTDPESRIMSTPEGFQQCYNAQAAASALDVGADAVTVTQPSAHFRTATGRERQGAQTRLVPRRPLPRLARRSRYAGR